jgi:hypothetical protein
MNAPLPQNSDAFSQALSGVLYGIMSWDQLDAFWNKLDPNAGWYLYAVGEAVPGVTADAEHVRQFITRIDALLRQEHQEDYCGIVYADDLENPGFIKIYDPNHLGSSCGSSKTPTLPGWIMSQIPPTELATKVLPQGRQRWWKNFLSSLR